MQELNPKILDRRAALDRLGDDQELYDEVLAVYRSDTPKQLTRLVEGVNTEDRKLVQIQAHSIKSASANIGADQMRSLAQRIEAIAMDEEICSLVQLVEELVKRFNETLSYIDGENG